MKLHQINTLKDIETFVNLLVNEEKLNFHPDTPFEDYVYIKSGKLVYSSQEAQHRNRLLNQAFELGNKLGVDTHELMCEEGVKSLR